MLKAEEEAVKASGGEGFVTLKSLSKEFTSEAWEPLKEEDSVLSRILVSGAFRNEEKGHSEHMIDTNYLICYALMLC